MNILIPIDITESMFGPATNLPRLGPGEVDWVAGTNYELPAEGAPVLQRVYGTDVYTLVRTTGVRNIPPPQDPQYWLKYGPTIRFSPFDMYRSTKAVGIAGVLTYEINLGFFDGIALHEIEAERIRIEIWDKPASMGGVAVQIFDRDLWEQATGLWELLFGDLRRETTTAMHNLDMYPLGVLKVTLTSSNPAAPPKLGYLSAGNWTSIIGRSRWGGTQYGVQATPKSYTYRKVAQDGTVELKYRGASSRNISGMVVLESDEASRALDVLERVLGKPVAIEMSELPKYSHFSTVGFVEGSVKAENWSMSSINITVEGII